MTADSHHGLAALTGVASLCGGVYLLAGAGASLSIFGSLLLVAVIYARTRSVNVRNAD